MVATLFIALATVAMAEAKMAAMTTPARPAGRPWVEKSGMIWSFC